MLLLPGLPRLVTILFHHFAGGLFALTLLSATPLQAQRQADSLAAVQALREADTLAAGNRHADAMAGYDRAAGRFEQLALWEQCLEAIMQANNARSALGDFAGLDREADRALAIIREKLAGRHPLQPAFLQDKAEVAMSQGRYPDALALQLEGLNYLKQYFPDRRPELARVYVNLAHTYGALGDTEAVLRQFQAARSLLADARTREERVILCRASINAGFAYASTGRFEEALALFDEAAALAETEGLTYERAVCLYNSSGILAEMGKVELALAQLEKTAGLFAEVRGPEHPMVGMTYNMMGLIYAGTGMYPEARAAHERSLAIARKNLGDRHDQVALALVAIGQLYEQENRQVEARAALAEGLAILDEVFPGPHPKKNEPYQLLAQSYFYDIARLDSACFYAQKTYDNSLAVFGPRNIYTANGLALLSECASKRNQPDRALLLAQQALMAASWQFDSPDPGHNPEVSDLINPKDALAVMANKAELLFQQWNDDPQPATAQQMLDCLERGREVLRVVMRRPDGSPGAGVASLSAESKWIKTGIRLTAGLASRAPSPEANARCFEWMELDKARRLLQAAQAAEAKAFAGLPDSLLQRDAALSQAIADIEQNLRAAEETRDSAAIRMLRDEALLNARLDHDRFIAELERLYPAYFDLKYRSEGFSLSELQRRLPAKTLLLELSVDPVEPGKLYLMAIRPDRSRLFSPALDPETGARIARLYALLQSPAVARAPRRSEFVQLSHALYRQFIQPIEGELAGVERLVVCGEGFTYYLPFEVLLRDGADKPVDELDFLVETLDVSYHYSAALYARNNPQPAASDVGLLAFAPVFGANAAAPSGLTRDTALRALDAEGRWTPLPYTETEVNTIARLFEARHPGSATVLLRDKADKAALRRGLTSGYRFVHIASHSFADTRRPRLSGIACHAPDSTASSLLYAGEIYNLAARADLVVLSSCESGMGRLLRGDGLLGLNRAFLYAGVPNVTFSLWKVNDRATADFMTPFYQAVLEGQTYASALRSAKLRMLSNPATASPSFWAGFLGIYRLK